jgi:replicative DNA helicase
MSDNHKKNKAGSTKKTPAGSNSIPSPISDLRVPPQSIHAEQALLGSIMIRPDCLHDIIDLVRPESFYLPKHEWIYSAVLNLFSKSEPIDALTLTNCLTERKHLDKCGGIDYIADLSQAVPSSANAIYYAEIIQKKHIARSLIKAAHDIASNSYEELLEIADLIDSAEKRLFEVSGLMKTSDVTSLPDELSGAFERLEQLSNSDKSLRGVSTGFKSLDNKLSGLQRSDLVILAARPSVGKTALALDIARQTALQHDSSVLIFSLEMSSGQLVDRMLAAESRVDAWRLRTGKVQADSDFAKLREALGRLSKAQINIDDQAGNTVLNMRSVARRVKRESGLDLVIVDYLQLMSPSGRFKNSDNMVQQVSEISRSLKILARELDVPVLALSQLSRAVEQRGGKPRLSDLRDSGSIEQDADVVMFIHREREEVGRSQNAEILIEKHRNGPVGRVELMFDPDKSCYLDIEQSDYDTFANGPESQYDGNFE